MQKTAGVLFFLAGATILLGILTAEIFYPTNYSVSLNMISNLGSTPPPDSIIRQPSATIFDHTLMLAGILIILGTYLLRSLKQNSFLIAAIMMGIGTFGVGIFPAFHAIVHPLVALAAFLSGAVAAIVSAKITKLPFSLFSILLGIISLLFLFLGIIFPNDIIPLLGKGGAERWVLYPLIIWLIGFGGYLMNTESIKKKKY